MTDEEDVILSTYYNQTGIQLSKASFSGVFGYRVGKLIYNKKDFTLQELCNTFFDEINFAISNAKLNNTELSDVYVFLLGSEYSEKLIDNRLKNIFLKYNSISEYEKQKQQLIKAEFKSFISELDEAIKSYKVFLRDTKNTINSFKNLISRNYPQYLVTFHWRKIRKDIIEKHKVCQKCGSKEKLHVHHFTYDNIGNEKEEDLILVCEDCHKKLHKIGG